jgi:predicted enzyme related to lactoylglutathione lyase
MIGKLDTVVLDAPDIARLSAFYQALAGWVESFADDDWIALETPDGWRIGLQAVLDHRPPQWPGQDRPQQAHLDFRVSDLEAGLDQTLELGGTLLRKNDAWYTMADPAGHPFDLCLKAEESGTALAGVMLDCDVRGRRCRDDRQRRRAAGAVPRGGRLRGAAVARPGLPTAVPS